MLQIATGKLFSKSAKRHHELRGILYSNLIFTNQEKIETAAGRLIPTSFGVENYGELVFEITEYIEQIPAYSRLVSRGIEPYIHDFSYLVSIGFNALCTVSSSERLRLTDRVKSASGSHSQSSLVPRVFDSRISINENEIDSFTIFVNDLIGLKRKYFREAMKAIRTYVVAMRTLPDNVMLSYTLLIASIESLAQSFKTVDLTWSDYDEATRFKLDPVLDVFDKNDSEKVKSVLLEVDKLKAKTKFREYTKAHLAPSFFREEATEIEDPIIRADLDRLLREAYDQRSGFVHRLNDLPKLLTSGAFSGETTRFEDRVHLTPRGLARLARHLILRYVSKQEKTDREPYDYLLECHGAMTVPLDAQYWVGSTEKLKLSDGRKRLVGHLNQLDKYFSNKADAEINDLRPMLTKAEGLFKSGSEDERRPLLALYLLFNAFLPQDQRMPNLQSIEERYSEEFLKPSMETLLVHVILKVSPEWKLAEYRLVLEAYFEQRNKRTSLVLPRTFEACVMLFVAEQYRLEDDSENARKMFSKAVECYPGYEPLLHAEKDFDPSISIDCMKTIFPEFEYEVDNSA